MYRSASVALTIAISLWAAFLAGCSPEGEDERKQPARTRPPRQTVSLVFNGGPSGGTFNYFANKMSALITENEKWMDITPSGSGGSLSNICALNLDQADMAILYAGDAFLGRNGKLDCEEARMDHVRTLAYLYGAPAQLVVRRDSDIHSVRDLKGKIVAVGNAGSGAALSAERFFRHLRLWNEIDHRNLGYSEAAANFGAGRVDAFWALVGYPNCSIIEAATHTPIRLIDLHGISVQSGFYDLYPFYVFTEIPSGTYAGQNEAVATFQDSALWCARKALDEDVVYLGLKAIFSEQGLEGMRSAHRAAQSMSEAHALDNLPVSLHPGAIRFWSERGKNIPAILLP
jgi:hypothetical protein